MISFRVRRSEHLSFQQAWPRLSTALRWSGALHNPRNHERKESPGGKCDRFHKSKARFTSHLCGEHGDVVKLSTPPLFHWHRQEEAAAVFGEDRLLVLQDTHTEAQTGFHSKPFRPTLTYTPTSIFVTVQHVEASTERKNKRNIMCSRT